MEDPRAKMGGFFVVVMFFGMAVTGAAAGAAVNGTLSEGNSGTMRLLMDSSGRQFREFSVDSCVNSVKEMRIAFAGDYASSFPPLGFVPPGAEEWCKCLEAEGIASIEVPTFPTVGFFQRSTVRRPFEQAFNRCRRSVLDGSDINTEDMCRGMFHLFDKSLGEGYVTFCGRLCRSLRYDYYYTYDRRATGLNLYYGCGRECVAETMPGYCEKYKVWYSEWKTVSVSYYSITSRAIGIGNTFVTSQSIGDQGRSRKRQVAQALCNALHPLLGGNVNECCNYARTFEALRDCCALDSNGFSVFDCEKNFNSKSVLYQCNAQHGLRNVENYALYCINIAEGQSTDLQVWKHRGTGDFLFTLDESARTKFCESSGRDPEGGSCCSILTRMNIAADCADPSMLTYLGRTAELLDYPTPGATEVSGEDPCLGLCKDGRECVVAGNGKTFCVDCTALLKPKRSGNLAECCTYDSEKKRCVTALKSSGPGICKRSEEIFVLTDKGNRHPVHFKADIGPACKNPRDFRRHGAACKVVERESGKVRCFD